MKRLLAASLLAPALLVSAPSFTGSATASPAKSSCTLTSKHTCIKAGQFCSPEKAKGKNVAGRALVCTGKHWHYA